MALRELRDDLGLQHTLMANPTGTLSEDPKADVVAWVARREAAGCFRVIDSGYGAVGFVQLFDIHRKNRFAWLGIALVQNARGNGLGKHALGIAEKIARTELGLRKLLLHVRADNVPARKLYDSAGWRCVGTLHAHYDDGVALHDVLIYEKALA